MGIIYNQNVDERKYPILFPLIFFLEVQEQNY